MAKKIILSVAISVMLGCASEQTYCTLKPCPPKPMLPRIMAEEFAAYQEETFNKLVLREERLRQYAHELEAYCDRR